MSVNRGPRIVTGGLVLHLDAGNSKSYAGSGTNWTDLSGNNYNSTLTNGPTYSSSNKGSIVFDGINDYVVGGDTSAVNGHHTLCIWTKNTGPPSTNDVYGGMLFAQSTDLNHGIIMQYGWQGQAVAFSDLINNGLVTGANTVLNNIIHYIVGVYDGSTQKIYVDNILLAQRNWTTNPVIGGTPSNQIGRWGFGGYERYFNGNIYSVSLYNRALSSNEISQNYNALKGRFNL